MQQLLTAQKETDKKKNEKKNKEKVKYLAGTITELLDFRFIFAWCSGL